MPARFILGPAGSGKTHHCLATLRERERAGKPGIFLVPEQSTHSAERELLSDPALAGLRHVQVLSFTRLAFRLREEAGVPPPARIGAAARTMLLRAVLAAMPDATLGPLAALRSRQGFLEELGRFVGEVRAHGTLDFLDAVRSSGTPKLLALAAVLEAYDRARLDLGLVDPEASLHDLTPLIDGQASRLRETRILVDGFLSWTRREREVLVALARTGAFTEIALCLEEGGAPQFIPATRTLARMRELLASAGVPEEAPLRLAPRSVIPPHLRVVPAADPRREVLEWARLIDRWTRLDSVPVAPEQIAVILRTVEPYREAIRETFPAYRIPFFLDEPHQLLAHPWARLYLDALEVLLSGWRRDAVIGFLRNPLLRAEPAALDLLENFSLEYGRDFDDWHSRESWGLFPLPERARMSRRGDQEPASPREGQDPDEEDEEGTAEEGEGFEAEDYPDLEPAFDPPPDPTHEPAVDSPRESAVDPPRESAADPLARVRDAFATAEELRHGALLPLRTFELQWNAENPDGAKAAAQLRALETALLDPVRPGTKAPAWDDPRPEWSSRVASALRELFDEAARLWPSIPVTLEEFARALRQGIAAARVPAVPVRFGQVTIAEVQRSRLSGIQRAIVGGVNDGIFPRTVGAESVLDERERDDLERRGLSLGPSASVRQEEETWFGYVALTRASEEVVLTYSRRDTQGTALEPSFLVEEVWSGTPGLVEDVAPAGTETLAIAELQTPLEAADRLASRAIEAPSGMVGAAGGERVDATVAGSAGHTGHTGHADHADHADHAGHADNVDNVDNVDQVGHDRTAEALLDELHRIVDRWEEGASAPTVSPDGSVLARIHERYEEIRPALEFQAVESLPPELVARALPGPDFESSVSRLTEFAKCPYLGFARGVLRLRPRPQAQVTPLETGTLSHAALEGFFKGPRPKGPSDVAGLLADVFEALRGRPEFLGFEVDRASQYRWDATRRSLERFLRLETERLKGSAYHPQALEDAFNPRIGNAVEIELGGGRRLLLAGRIDRIDTRQVENEPVRALVLDYKRSKRIGVPEDVARGLDLQLVAYMLYARQVMGWTPVGGLYVPVLPSPVRDEELKRDATNSLGIQASGIFLAEEREAIDGGVGFVVGARGGQSKQVVPDAATLETTVETGRGFLAAYASSLLSGWIPARPLELQAGQFPCDHCDYGALCRFRRDRDPVRHEPAEGMPVQPPAAAGSEEGE